MDKSEPSHKKNSKIIVLREYFKTVSRQKVTDQKLVKGT